LAERESLARPRPGLAFATMLFVSGIGFLSFGLSLAGTLCLLALEFWPARALAYAYVVFLFLPIGTRATIVAMLVPRIAPPGKFGTVFGWLSVGNSLGAATSATAATPSPSPSSPSPSSSAVPPLRRRKAAWWSARPVVAGLPMR